MFVFFITGYRRAVKVGWAMGERQKRNHVLTSFANHIHLPNDFQLLPSRYSGIFYYFTCNYLLANYLVKFNLVLEAFSKCFVVHLLKFEILKTT